MATRGAGDSPPSSDDEYEVADRARRNSKEVVVPITSDNAQEAGTRSLSGTEIGAGASAPLVQDADADNDAGGATAAAACAPAAATNASSDVDNLTNLPSNGKKGRGGRRGSVGARLSGCLSRRGSVGDTDNMRRLQRRSSVGAEEDGKPGRCRTLGNMLNPSQAADQPTEGGQRGSQPNLGSRFFFRRRSSISATAAAGASTEASQQGRQSLKGNEEEQPRKRRFSLGGSGGGGGGGSSGGGSGGGFDEKALERMLSKALDTRIEFLRGQMEGMNNRTREEVLAAVKNSSTKIIEQQMKFKHELDHLGSRIDTISRRVEDRWTGY